MITKNTKSNRTGFKKLLIKNGWKVTTETNQLIRIQRPYYKGKTNSCTAIVDLDKELFYNFSTCVNLKPGIGYTLEDLKKEFKKY